MKHVLSVALGAALLVDIVLFAGIGFGTGALAVVNGATGNFMPSYQNGSDNGAGALTFGIGNTVQTSGQPMVSSLTSSGSSTTLTVGILAYSNGNCGGAGGPADAVGGSDPNYFTFEFVQNGNPQNVLWSIAQGSSTSQSQQVQAAEPSYSFNNTNNQGSNNPALIGCIQGSNGNVYTTNLCPPNENCASFYPLAGTEVSVSIQGQIGQGTLVVQFHAGGSNCAGSGSSPPVNDCASLNSLANFGGLHNAGSWSATSQLSVPVLDGGASARLVGAGPWYNGGTLQVQVSTGYGGQGGYTLGVYYPAARASVSGQLDPSFATLSPGNNLVNSVFSWTIPSGTSIACSQPGCNEFQIELYSSLFVNTHLNFPVDISPAYAPQNSTIAYTVNTGAYYPHVGDSVTLTFSASAAHVTSANNVTGFLIQIFYLQPNQDVHSSPGCGGQWVTNCAGTTVPSVQSKNGTYTATYSFTVSPPNGMSGIGVIAQSTTQSQQSSGLAYRFIAIAPTTCSSGQKCDPTVSNLALWQLLGPILFSLAIVLGALLLVVTVPMAMTIRVLTVAASVAGVVVLYVFAYASWFAPGGVF